MVLHIPTENLYEVVVSIPSAQKDEFEKQWQKHADRDMEMHWIGFVGQGNIQMRANLVIPREEITQRYGASYEAFMA